MPRHRILKVTVGNSSKVVVNEEVLLRVKFSHFEANLWFFIFDHLPVQTLIGWPAMKRLKLGTDGDYILELLDDRRNRRSKTLVTTAVTSGIPPRSAVIVPLTAKGQVSSPECFFFPRDSGKGKLIAPQGLISITQKERHEINDDDVEQTELLQISNRSLLDLQDIQPFNSKVGANYFKALNSPWLDAWVAKENKMLFLKEGRKRKFSENFAEEISPIQSQKQPKINPTMETDAFDESKINQVFALLANPENEPPDFGEENQMKSLG